MLFGKVDRECFLERGTDNAFWKGGERMLFGKGERECFKGRGDRRSYKPNYHNPIYLYYTTYLSIYIYMYIYTDIARRD